jgi:hypothetical protein
MAKQEDKQYIIMCAHACGVKLFLCLEEKKNNKER